MDEIFCPLTKSEVTRIVDHLETMHSIFWARLPNYTAKAVQEFLNSKNIINMILLKATGRMEK